MDCGHIILLRILLYGRNRYLVNIEVMGGIWQRDNLREEGENKKCKKVRVSPSSLTVFPLHTLSLHLLPPFRTFGVMKGEKELRWNVELLCTLRWGMAEK